MNNIDINQKMLELRQKVDKETLIGWIIETCLETLKCGETFDANAILEANPDIAGELKTRFELAGILPLTYEIIKVPAEVWGKTKACIIAEYDNLCPAKEPLQVSEPGNKSEKQVFLPVDHREDVLLLLLYSQGRNNKLAEAIWGTLRLAKELFYIAMKTPINSLVKNYYDYQADACGPFTDEIYKDIRNLKQGGLITDEPPRQKKVTGTGDINIAAQPAQVSAVYKLTEKGVTIAEKLYEWAKLNNPELLQEIAQIKIRLADMTPKQMVQEIDKEYPKYTEFCKLLNKEINNGE